MKYLVLLDIDNTLITGCSEKEKPQNITPDLDNRPNGLRPPYVFKRPNLDDFLDFLFANFTVALWSAGKRKWVNQIVDNLLQKYKGNFLFIWTGEDCSKKRIKSLQKVWDQYPNWSSGNTILIDDRLSENPENQIQLCPFIPSNQMDQDQELTKVKYTLSCLSSY